jgi:hypothetical protein
MSVGILYNSALSGSHSRRNPSNVKNKLLTLAVEIPVRLLTSNVTFTVVYADNKESLVRLKLHEVENELVE